MFCLVLVHKYDDTLEEHCEIFKWFDGGEEVVQQQQGFFFRSDIRQEFASMLCFILKEVSGVLIGVFTKYLK